MVRITLIVLDNKGTHWLQLGVTDNTLNMSRSGNVTFFPPKDWRVKSISQFPLFYIRLRTVSFGMQVLRLIDK